MIFPADI